MSSLYIAEYTSMGNAYNDRALQAPQEPPLNEQVVSISGSTTQSSAFKQATRFVRLHSDAICSIVFGNNPTATTSSKRLVAGQTEYFAVNGGDKVAVITNV